MTPKSFAYIQNLRIPHEMAHGVAVVKAAEAAGELVKEAYLLHPKRRQTPELKGAKTTQYYDIEESFKEVEIAVPELIGKLGPLEVLYKPFRHLTISWIFALKATFFSWKRNIEVIQTGDREILFLLRIISFSYKPQVIYDLHNDFADRYNKTLLTLSHSVILLAVVNCQYLEKYIKAYNQGIKTLILPNGYDPKYYGSKKAKVTREDLSIPKDAFVFGYIGRFETMKTEKGVGLMIEAAAKLVDEIPIHILAVGGPPKLLQKYHQLATTLGILENVRLEDQVLPSEVADYIDLIDVGSLLYPDIFHFREKMSPMKAIEYLAAGKPILASDLPSIRHLLGSEAEYVEPESVDAVVAALRNMYKNRKAIAKETNKRKDYVKQFTWSRRQQTIFDALV